MRVFVFVLCFTTAAYGQELSTLTAADSRIAQKYEQLALNLTDESDIPESAWVLRSEHFLFGMPRLVDRRHDFEPEDMAKQPGISVLVREGFVVAHFDRMRSPLFVCQRWTQPDYKRMEKFATLDRNWKEDLELPIYARAGTSYDHEETMLQRGHMARHELNCAWGKDNSAMGCLMSNATPQRPNVNVEKGWRDLEDALRDIVKKGKIDAIWTINGTLFEKRDSTNPENDFENTRFVGGGFGEPEATYKVVGWFDEENRFQARGYVFEKDDEQVSVVKHLTKIRDIEKRAGVDFFPQLRDSVENAVETTEYHTMWANN